MKQAAASFFQPQARHALAVPPTVKPPPLLYPDPPEVLGSIQGHKNNPMPSGSSATSTSVYMEKTNLLSKLRTQIDKVPFHTQGSGQEKPAVLPLARFYGILHKMVNRSEDIWEQWDGPLNTALQRSPEELEELVHIEGRVELTHLCNFLKCLVDEHGISEVLLERKVSRLINVISTL